MADRPLVTFILFGYNQEAFIGDAIRGALEQTYEPLMVILSDDCSSDGTFAIMERAAAKYHGRHWVIARRNRENLGHAAHISAAAACAVGKAVVLADGDDISLPTRTAATMDALTANPRATAVSARTRLIDAVGASIKGVERQSSAFGEAAPSSCQTRVARFIKKLRPGLLGGASTWRRGVFDLFGPLDATVQAPDLALAFRALLLGEVATTDHVGVLYRIHASNNSRSDQQDLSAWAEGKLSEAGRVTWLRVTASLYPQMKKDLTTATQLELLDFDPEPHVLELQRREQVIRLLAEQPRSGIHRRAGIAVQVLGLRPEPRTARAALLRILPTPLVERIRGIKPAKTS